MVCKVLDTLFIGVKGKWRRSACVWVCVFVGSDTFHTSPETRQELDDRCM